MGTLIAAVLWLSGSAAWASGLNSLKYLSDPTNMFKQFTVCDGREFNCVSTFAGNFAGLNISVVSYFFHCI